MNDEIQTVEIAGVKYEVNMAGARKISQFAVGNRVKVLIKDYSGYKSHPGVIVGIDLFKALPTVVVAYVEPTTYNENASVQFAYLNAQSKDTEIAPMCEDDLMPTRDTILAWFKRAEDEHTKKIEAIREKREYFLRRFGAAVGVTAAELGVQP